jgi:hypothetical protein
MKYPAAKALPASQVKRLLRVIQPYSCKKHETGEEKVKKRACLRHLQALCHGQPSMTKSKLVKVEKLHHIIICRHHKAIYSLSPRIFNDRPV